jgi:hypothetical protein
MWFAQRSGRFDRAATVHTSRQRRSSRRLSEISAITPELQAVGATT